MSIYNKGGVATYDNEMNNSCLNLPYCDQLCLHGDNGLCALCFLEMYSMADSVDIKGVL